MTWISCKIKDSPSPRDNSFIFITHSHCLALYFFVFFCFCFCFVFFRSFCAYAKLDQMKFGGGREGEEIGLHLDQ